METPEPLTSTLGIVLVAIIPVVSAVVGWFTNVVALEFVGFCKPFFGWQGIIPSKAEDMTERAVDLITTKLLTVQEVFSRLSPQEISQELRPHMPEHMGRVISGTAQTQVPAIWGMLSDSMKAQLTETAVDFGQPYVAQVFQDLQDNVEEVFNLKQFCIDTLMKDVSLIVDIFLKCGAKEFDFIRKSGFYFGFLFGLIQMVVYIFFPAVWVLPLAGLVVGTATNFIALKIIFEPVDPVFCCGKRLQGLFLQRQDEVAIAYGEIVAEKVINPPLLVKSLLEGPSAAAVFGIVRKRMTQCVDDYVASGKFVLAATIGREQYQEICFQLSCRVMDEMPSLLSRVQHYTAEVLDVEAVLRERMIQMSSRDFEQLLHPVFQEDEWKLILLGGVLGALVGAIQAGINETLVL